MTTEAPPRGNPGLAFTGERFLPECRG